MMRVFRGFTNGAAAIYEEPSGSGAIDDINAPRNAPAKDPANWLDYLTWHSDCFQYEIAAQATVNIDHTSLEGRTLWYGLAGGSGFTNGSTTKPASGISIGVRGQVRTQDLTLLTHNLGYVPLFMVAYQGHSLPNGMIVQKLSSRGRIVSAYATSTIIGIREVTWSSNQAIAAVSRSYEVMCFRTPAVVARRKTMEMDGARLIIGRGKVDTSKQYLRRVKAGESSFDIDRGPTTHYKNGAVRVATGGQVIDETDYNGDFVGPGFVPVGV